MVGGWASRTCTKGDGIGDFERAPERFGLSRLERRVCYTGCCEPGHGSTGDVARAGVERHDAAVAAQESREPALPAAMLVERQPGRCSARAVYMPCACRAHAVRMPCACRAHAVRLHRAQCTVRVHSARAYRDSVKRYTPSSAPLAAIASRSVAGPTSLFLCTSTYPGGAVVVGGRLVILRRCRPASACVSGGSAPGSASASGVSDSGGSASGAPSCRSACARPGELSLYTLW